MLRPAANPDALDRLTAALVQVFPRLLGAIFVYAGIQKIIKRDSLYGVLRFDHVPLGMIKPVAWGVISVELLLGAMLLLFLWKRRLTLTWSIALLVLYSMQLGFLVLSPDAPSCGCLGELEAIANAQKLNMMSLGRNICLVIPALWVWLQLPAAASAIRVDSPAPPS